MSQSEKMDERFRRRLAVRRAAAFAYVASSIVYLGWRLTIFNEHAITLSAMYFMADLFAVILGVLAIFVSWDYRHRKSPPPPAGLSVDVLIPAYKEPVEMIRRTLKGALAIRYPHRTWLLDDAGRDDLRALAAELGCEYVVRSDNAGAKAGNINHALGLANGEFVAVFDADHIPRPHALDATLGFFGDPKVAMVQTPQDYYNIDALQYANDNRTGALWHDQSFFYNISQPGRDAHGAASCAGTSVVYRRSALQEIGGIPSATVTEDVHTSLKLHKLGYSAPYLNEPIAYGVAASDLADYYRTRHRYGHGNIHALREENVFFCKGLTWRQRLSYLFLGLIYLEGWQQLLVFLVPAIALIFGIAPFDITVFNVLVVLLFPLWTYALMQEIGCGFSRYWTNEIFAMFRWPVHIVSVTALFSDRLAWRSSRKNLKGRVNWNLLAPQILVVALSLSALGAGVWRLQQDFSTGPLLAIVLDRIPSAEAVTDRIDRAVEDVRDIARSVFGDAEQAETPGQGEAAPAGGAVAQDEPPPLLKAPPRPINWFRPMTTGYTADLVLVAGFWALINALRGIFVIFRVVANARQSREDYAFQWMLPVEIGRGEHARLMEGERLSPSEVRIAARDLRALRESGVAFPVAARIFLPGGAVEVELGEAAQGDRFLPILAGEKQKQAIDDALYAVAWHRALMHHDAEFGTPLSFLARLIGFSGGQAAKPASRRCGLIEMADESGERREEPVVLLSYKRRKETESLVAFRPLETGAVADVRLAGDVHPAPRRLLVRECRQEFSEVTASSSGMQLYRHRVQAAANADAPGAVRQLSKSAASPVLADARPAVNRAVALKVRKTP